MWPERIIEHGIYFNLPAEIYHRSEWCGSGDIKKLYASPSDYWYESHMNPLREVDEESQAFKFGRAIHDRVLFGEEFFKKHYLALEGGNKDGTVSAETLKDWLKEQGAYPSKLKADNERMAIEEFGVTLVAEKIYNQILLSTQMILANPALLQAFSGGWPEVSIFWHESVDDQGLFKVPCKCRIDYLKLTASVDLKSFSSKERLMTIDGMVIADIKKYKYQVQAYHYTRGRLAAAALAADGKVFAAAGDFIPDAAWLKKCFGKVDPAFVFVAFKSDGAPVSKSYEMLFGGPWLNDGASYQRRALVNYQAYFEKYGTEIWVNVDEPYILVEEDFKFVD